MSGFFRKELAYTCILLLGSMSHGLVMAFWSPCKVSMSENLGFADNNNLCSLFNFFAPFACIFGGPIISLLINKKGRRISVFITALLMFISWIIMVFVKESFKWLAFIMRFLTGFCVGAYSTVIPMYITELAPTEVRGAYGTLHQMGIGTGASLCYLIGIWLDKHWRKIGIISACPSGLLSILVWLIPESPAVYRQQESNSVHESLCQSKFIRPLTISVFLMFFQQFAGTSAFLANLQDIFNKCHININSNLASFIVGFSGVFAVLITSAIIRFCGRRPAWHISSAAQAIALVLGACNEKWNWSPFIPVVCLIADNFFFSIGLAPIPWFFVPELFPDSVRHVATSCMTAVNWTFGSALFYLWDVMEAGIGMTWSFATFAIIMVLSLIFGIIFLPEPKGEMGEGIESNNFEPLSKNDGYQQIID
ncbi:glucose import [Tritrichomonas musculus]|uniref:Glucose import n=1 Tax=Tritrichomonas musculus TaxID=1915356 RepID=A0ABR2KZ36_9EUKA